MPLYNDSQVFQLNKEKDMNVTKLTAMEFANERENVVIRYASQGASAGQDIAWFPPETELPFDLEKIEGEIGEDGQFTATNLNVEGGAHGWQFNDWNSNYIYALWLRVDEGVYAKQYEELEERDYEWNEPFEADEPECCPECCPECGFPADGSSGHGHCDHECHGAT